MRCTSGEEERIVCLPPPEYEPFHPNGLLDPSGGITGDISRPGEAVKTAQNGDVGSHGFGAQFKPLNVTTLGKRKNDAQPPTALPHASGKPHSSLDGTLCSAKPFSAGQQARLGAPNRPVSPFFPSSSSLSMHHFRAPTAPPQITRNDDFSSNKAHIVSFQGSLANEPGDLAGKPLGPPLDQSYRLAHALDTSFGSLRSRTASQPSLASIHEVAEEEEATSPQKLLAMESSPANIVNGQRGYARGYEQQHPFSDTIEDEAQMQQGLRRSIKRAGRGEEDEDEFEYGTGAKRYKPAEYQDNFAPLYNGQVSPTHRPGTAYERTVTPAHVGGPLFAPSAQFPPGSVKGPDDMDKHRRALYMLLGQDFDVVMEAHADAYQQARKKWSECSVEEWTQGADELAGRFGKMLDFVKDHMTTKLALYASMQTNIDEHKQVLSEREKTLKEARESLVREGGAVVGSMPVLAAPAEKVEVCGI
ncbi:hypothetical protein ONZ51_g12895 [Trametes cubensis]|uniref:Extracellular mutant protein 11 C-terminal domain-containing protein n=1 Tax=Trametes cubensis TaxID=1111947 RepID=A0AAD7TEZ4_9APHY|nr:hypothetical protein ONZ51_g12895 [Trametes cubensis]